MIANSVVLQHGLMPKMFLLRIHSFIVKCLAINSFCYYKDVQGDCIDSI